MPAQVAANIVALRPCFEALIVKVAKNPAILMQKTDLDHELVDLLKILSAEETWKGSTAIPVDRTLPPSAPNYPTTQFYRSGPIRDYVPNNRPAYNRAPYNRDSSRGRYSGAYSGNANYSYQSRAQSSYNNRNTPGFGPGFGNTNQDFTDDTPFLPPPPNQRLSFRREPM